MRNLDRRWRRWTGYSTAAVMAVSLASVPSRADADPGPRWAALPKDETVTGAPARMEPLPTDSAATVRALAEPTWPAAGSASVDLATVGAGARGVAAARAGKLPVWVAPTAQVAAGRAAGPARVRVEVLDRAATERAGVPGVLIRLAAESDTATEKAAAKADVRAVTSRAAVSVDYGAFAGAFGGDWTTRLRFVPVPECALSTPDRPECWPGDPVLTRNDTTTKRVTAELDTATGLYALFAGVSGSGGDYSATSLAPSSTWQVSPQTGDFTWQYELDTPPGLNGPEPQVAIGYSSGSVDGRIASTNNQTSWVGEGFDLAPGGFIERRYKPCADDGSAGSPKRGDLCFAYDNATMSLNGAATELLYDDETKTWQPKNDDGTRIERLTGAVNGDKEEGEYWRVTTIDGTQYYFGLNRLPTWKSGDPETNSTWTVPVYGNNSGEPCYKASFADAWCQQAWRWNLDYVVDPRGNAMAYFYAKETNYYARNRSTATQYVRGGYLTEIRYGLRKETPYATAPVRVVFGVSERCLPSGTITCSDAQFTTANARYWPDTPVDQNCKSGQSCSTNIAPSFWTRKRLTSVTTQVLRGSAYSDVDVWTLRHTFPASDSGTPALWLAGITHEGRVGGTLAQPEIEFQSVQMPNRVDGQENIPPMVKRRVRTIVTESGGTITVTYSDLDCAVGALPVPDSNTRRCFPTIWQAEGETKPKEDWFHKYVTTQVVEDSRIAGEANEVTSYEYVGGAAWHFADDDGLVKEKEKTWSQWRGYERVRVRQGTATELPSETEYLYLRGMNGDKQSSGTPRQVSVTPSEGPPVPDDPHLQGFLLEEIERSGPGGAEISSKINDPWVAGPTAVRERPWGVTRAYTVNVARVRTRVPLASGGYRRTETATTYTAEGLPAEVDDAGDTAVTGDEKCTRHSYARAESEWMLSYPSRVTTVAAPCTTPLRTLAAEDIISDEQTSYDGQAAGAPPTKGLPTLTEEMTATGGFRTTARNVYDIYGRVVESYDTLNNKTTTVYTPATGGPLTKKTVTNPLGHVETTEYDPAWGEELVTVDEGGKRTEFAYDPLGRLSKVWLPGRSRNQTPSEEYSYEITKDKPSVVVTRQLGNDGSSYSTSYEIFDALLRPRQTQTPAPGGGRVLTDVYHDTRGMVVKQNQPYYYDAQPPSGDLVVVPDAQIPAQVAFLYDGAGRETAEIFKVRGVEKWRTTTTYGGDRVTVDPPQGETATTTILDAAGATVELWQYHGDSPTGPYDVTRYSHTKDGELATVTDSMNNVRRHHYDLRGRLVAVDDPDAGRITYRYDDEDRLVSSTDARGRTLSYTYDALDRITATYEGTTKLTEYTYDTLVKGELTSKTRYVDGNAYTVTVTGYDEADHPTGIRYTIPASEGALAGTYEFRTTYHLDGSVATSTHPAVGGLPAETVRYGYDALGMPTTLTGLTSYVTESLYSKLGEEIRHVYSTGGKSVVRTYEYEDGTRRLKRVITERDGTPQRVSDVSYDYDPAGNILRISDAPPEQAADTQCFQYDHLRRMTEAWTPRDGNCAATRSVAALGGPAPYWYSYSYDKVGNRTKEVRHALGGDTTRTYTTPAAGTAQPHTLTSVSTSGPDGTRTDTYAYDASGNTIKRVVNGVTQELEWTVEGHLAKVTEGTKVTSYVYDADGERLIRRAPDSTTLYLGGTELTLKNGQVSGLRYYSHGGDVVAVRTPAGVRFLFSDHHGTDELSIDATTMAVTQRRFDPFGAPRGPQPADWTGDRAFVGGTHDPSTGLIHLGAREYDPLIGRFISLDPIIDVEDPQQMHGYAYANNSPETFSDPDGKWSFCGWCKRAWSAAKRAAAAAYARWKAWMAWKAWKARVEAARRWAKQKAEAAKRAAKKAKQLARKVVRKAKHAARKAYHAAKKQVKKHVRAFKNVAKRAAKAATRAAKKAGRAVTKAAKWVDKHVDWGKVWTVTKVALAVVAMFSCTICAIAAYATMAISAIEAANSVRTGDYAGAAMAMVPGGAAGRGARFAVNSAGEVTDFGAAAAKLWGRQVPSGWMPRVANNGKGVVFQRSGAQGNADMIRVMDPTPMYPQGYVRIHNSHGQPVDVNGKPGSKAATHIPLGGSDPWNWWPS
ncbi:RHS repeat-associated core domain-containing protein [Micromonospora sp. HM5-17]|uniref:RHS repeat-associated core domain-containing protein n=1 Tax=Micromonospora sp. HM5-17 TaxID=2487710 RepID=UPI0011CECA21|nr:RHS repeat-associated core domain-containing protein [Micromonospora sp. HM5-17]